MYHTRNTPGWTTFGDLPKRALFTVDDTGTVYVKIGRKAMNTSTGDMTYPGASRIVRVAFPATTEAR